MGWRLWKSRGQSRITAGVDPAVRSQTFPTEARSHFKQLWPQGLNLAQLSKGKESRPPAPYSHRAQGSRLLALSRPGLRVPDPQSPFPQDLGVQSPISFSITTLESRPCLPAKHWVLSVSGLRT